MNFQKELLIVSIVDWVDIVQQNRDKRKNFLQTRTMHNRWNMCCVWKKIIIIIIIIFVKEIAVRNTKQQQKKKSKENHKNKNVCCLLMLWEIDSCQVGLIIVDGKREHKWMFILLPRLFNADRISKINLYRVKHTQHVMHTMKWWQWFFKWIPYCFVCVYTYFPILTWDFLSFKKSILSLSLSYLS